MAAFATADLAHRAAPGSILVTGSGLIAHWNSWVTDFPEVTVINPGFGGSGISDSTFLADRVVAP